MSREYTWEEFERLLFPKQTEEEKRKILTPEVAKRIIKIIKPYTKENRNATSS